MSVEEPTPYVLTELDGAVATLTLNRPAQFNVLSGAMLAALQTALDQTSANPAPRVVILTGAGRAFCAGHDLRELRAMADAETLAALFARCSNIMLTLASMPQPVIACVQGVATAAGCQLVAACDLAIAGRSARFATSGVNLGLFCSTPAVAITRNLAAKHAAELLFTGESISAEQAERWALVNRCVDDATLRDEAVRWAQAIASKSRTALASGKALLRTQRSLPLSDAYNFAGNAMANDLQNVDAARGIDAFIQKKPTPDWSHQ
jgi:enoyl-CoA hydratase/carnithine racemase